MAQACSFDSSPIPASNNTPDTSQAGPVTLNPNLGGDTTRFETSNNAFGLPAPELTNEERRLFERGDSFFTQNWVTAPASTDARDGLGPTFNAQSCSSCHGFDGRGFPLEDSDGEARLGLLVRLSNPGSDPLTGASLGDPDYGGQFQDRSTMGVPAEGSVTITYETITGTYADGIPFELRKPTFAFTGLAFGPLDNDVMMSPRLAPQVMGVGLLEAIPDEDLLELADPNDTNSDGISGRPNLVWNAEIQDTDIGRFGWKAEQPTVNGQVAAAFAGDIGITSTLSPDQNCPSPQIDCAAAINGGNPKLTDDRLSTVTFYNRTLAVPGMRDHDTPDVQAGSQRF